MFYLISHANAMLSISTMVPFCQTGNVICALWENSIILFPEEIEISVLQLPFGLYILSTRYEDGTVKGKVVVKL